MSRLLCLHIKPGVGRITTRSKEGRPNTSHGRANSDKTSQQTTLFNKFEISQIVSNDGLPRATSCPARPPPPRTRSSCPTPCPAYLLQELQSVQLLLVVPNEGVASRSPPPQVLLPTHIGHRSVSWGRGTSHGLWTHTRASTYVTFQSSHTYRNTSVLFSVITAQLTRSTYIGSSKVIVLLTTVN